MGMPDVNISGGRGTPLRGSCPLCPGSSITPVDETKGDIEQKGSIRALFLQHFMKAHPEFTRSTKQIRENP
jgi:hypothetical protein